MAAPSSMGAYPKVIKLYHGKKFKLGLDFDDVPGVGTVISKVHEGYPAFLSELVAQGDVIVGVNGVAPRDVPHMLELCACRGGRGTDEYVMINLKENQAELLAAHQLTAPQPRRGAPAPASGLVKKVIRTVSFSRRSRASRSSTASSQKGDAAVVSSKRGIWAD